MKSILNNRIYFTIDKIISIKKQISNIIVYLAYSLVFCLGSSLFVVTVATAEESSFCKKVFNSVVFKIQSVQKQKEKQKEEKQKQAEENEKQKRIKSIQERDRLELVISINNQLNRLVLENRVQAGIFSFWETYANFDKLPKQYSEKFDKFINQYILHTRQTDKEQKDLIDKIEHLQSQKNMTLADENQLTSNLNQLFRVYYRLMDNHTNLLQMTNRQLENLIEESKEYFLLPVGLDVPKNQTTYRRK